MCMCVCMNMKCQCRWVWLNGRDLRMGKVLSDSQCGQSVGEREGRGSQLFNSLMAWRKKLFWSLLVCDPMLRYRLPEGNRENSPWLGWLESSGCWSFSGLSQTPPGMNVLDGWELALRLPVEKLPYQAVIQPTFEFISQPYQLLFCYVSHVDIDQGKIQKTLYLLLLLVCHGCQQTAGHH